MKVDQSTVVQQSTTSYSEKNSKMEKMTTWVGDRPEEGPARIDNNKGMLLDMLDLSATGLELSQTNQMGQLGLGQSIQTNETPKEEDLMSQMDQLKIKLIEEMMSRLTGRNFKFRHLLLKLRNDDENMKIMNELKESSNRLQNAFSGISQGRLVIQQKRPSEIRDESVRIVAAAGTQVQSGSVIKSADGSVRIVAEAASAQSYSEKDVQVQNVTYNTGKNSGADVGWGMDYKQRSEYLETETMSFKSQGTVKLQDGREITFDYSLNMSRAYYESSQMSIRAGDALKDPLVINMDGKGAALTDKTMKFDIDVDGKSDSIPVLAKGSGYLVFDRNENGIMDDGSELFGTKSGKGFEDLKAYDSDKNGWIDENDAAFKNMKVWVSDGNGNGKLVGLIAADVGAIYLGDVSTDFHIKNTENTTLGAVKNSSIYLRESGKAGSIQELDLKI